MNGLTNTSMGDFEHEIEPGAIVHIPPCSVFYDPKAQAQRMVQDRALSLLKQDHSHARRIREFEIAAKADQMRIAKLEGALELARRVLIDGDESERRNVAEQIKTVITGDKAWR